MVDLVQDSIKYLKRKNTFVFGTCYWHLKNQIRHKEKNMRDGVEWVNSLNTYGLEIFYHQYNTLMLYKERNRFLEYTNSDHHHGLS